MTFSRLLSSAGIGPVKSFHGRFRFRRLANSPSLVGIGPLNALPGRDRSVTRPVESAVTPYHSPSGADVFQFVLSAQLGPPVPSYSASSAARSAAAVPDAGKASTVTVNDWSTVRPPGSAAVTPIVAAPSPTAVTITRAPTASTLATCGADDDTV